MAHKSQFNKANHRSKNSFHPYTQQNRLEHLKRLAEERDQLDTLIAETKSSLLDRISDSPTLTLAQRLEQPSIKELGLKRTPKEKKTRRYHDMLPKVTATKHRIMNLRKPYPTLESPLFVRFNTFEMSMFNRHQDFTNRQWRSIARDCSAIGKIANGLNEKQLKGEFDALFKYEAFKYE